METERARELLERVSVALTSLKSKGNLLEGIAWSREIEEAFFASSCEELPRPTYSIDRDALDDESSRLERLARTIEGDGPIATFLRCAVRSAVDRLEALDLDEEDIRRLVENELAQRRTARLVRKRRA